MRKSLLVKILIFSVLLEIIAFVCYFILPEKNITQTLLFQVPFFFSASFLANNYMLRMSTDKNPNKFVRAFMITTFLRFMLYILIIAAYVFSFRTDAVNFLITFFILFFLYLIFDVYFLLYGIPKR
jgi:glycerol uptake facilitator-like aquaporin